MNKTNSSSNTSNIFKKIKRQLSKGSYPIANSDGEDSLLKKSADLGTHETPYYSPNQTNILFLSKRGMSRAPLAREIMRHLLHFSDHFASIRPSARGTSDAYDFCPFDKRMIQSAQKFGYELNGNSRRVNMAELSSANLIVPLDRESEEYTKTRNFYIHGAVRPIGQFLNPGQSPYIADPFERDELWDIKARYDEIIKSVEFGCGKMLRSLPCLIS